MTLDDLCEHISLSRTSIRRLLRARRIPFIALALPNAAGHPRKRLQIRFDRSAIDLWMGRMAVKDVDAAYAELSVAVLTGLRKSDITGLRWANLDFENNLINLVQGKTNTPLSIEMSEVLATLLKSLPKSPSRTFVFSEDDKPLAGHGWVRDDFEKAVQQAGVAPLQFRDLRRTFGTQQALMGTQEKVIRELLGHKTSWMTQKYIRVVQSMRKDAVDKLGQKIGPIPTQHDATDMATNEIYESDVRH